MSSYLRAGSAMAVSISLMVMVISGLIFIKKLMAVSGRGWYGFWVLAFCLALCSQMGHVFSSVMW